jgi:N-carbamoyl-L-amino-acid hydrolase
LTALARARRLFAELAEAGADPPGVTRASFGAGEGAAHAMIRREAAALGLQHRTDAIGNLYVTLPGRDRDAPALMTGSHLDSVPHGGNFDGAAGVLAGLVLLERLADGPPPPCDVTLMAIRAEEMIWFPEHYLGSRAAFGLLPPDAPDRVRRSDTGRTLAEHMTEQGFDPDAIRQGRPQLDAARIRAFVELHIEQGPVLAEADRPVGIVSGIRGNIRHRFGRIEGETTHAGGVPRAARRDAVLAGAELASRLEAFWADMEARGADMVLTIGEFATDPARHGITKVPGEVRFTLDARSLDEQVLDAFETELARIAREITDRRGVHLDPGPRTRAAAAPMAPDIVAGLQEASRQANVEAPDLPSGGGHDCAVFAAEGVRAGMLFVRNYNGSHNPAERLEFDDFAQGCATLLAWARAELDIPS